MTVKELIQELQKYDENALVVIPVGSLDDVPELYHDVVSPFGTCVQRNLLLPETYWYRNINDKTSKLDKISAVAL